MTRVLIVDDEPINHQLVAHALEPMKFETHFAGNGNDALSLSRTLMPDLIITDVMMPDITGYELTRILRRDPQFAATPILILTAQTGLQDKIKSFEAGADDHLTKPFNEDELLARVTSLLRRVESVRVSRTANQPGTTAKFISIHSLRGGIGSSSLAVNLGLGLHSLWKQPTTLLDLTMTAGQVALMLNMTLRRTWGDIARFNIGELDEDALNSIISTDESGLSCIPAPTFPTEAESLNSEVLAAALQLLKNNNEYVVADLPHDFSEVVIQALDASETIMLLASADLASVRAAAAAIDTYDKLGYQKEKIKLVINSVFPNSKLTAEKIGKALGMTPVCTIQYVQDLFVEAINSGQPLLRDKVDHPVSGLLEDLSFHISKDVHKKQKPQNPTDAWNRVYKRYQKKRK